MLSFKYRSYGITILDSVYEKEILEIASSTKLKLIQKNGWEIYRDLANKLIDKYSFSEHDLSELIQKLLKMRSNLEDYLN